MEAREPSARHLGAVEPSVLWRFDLLTGAPGGVARLRELILALAVSGKLVPQDLNEESAPVLLQRIGAKKATTGQKLKGGALTAAPAQDQREEPFELPRGWTWTTLSDIGLVNPRNVADDAIEASFVQMSSIPVAYTESHASELRLWGDIRSGFTQFAEGDVGVAKITPCFENGKSTVFQNLQNGIGAGTTELHVVRPLGGIAPRYILAFMKSPGFLRGGEAVMTGTAGQKRLPRTYFETCPFPLPPIAEQARIVARVDELMRLCDALEANGRLEAEQHARLLSTLLGTLTDSTAPEELAANWQRVADHFDLLLDRAEAVDVLEETILQLAVRGLLVSQDPNDEPAIALVQSARLMREKSDASGSARRGRSSPSEVKTDELFALPAGWTWSVFPDLCAITGGSTPSKAVASNWIGDVPWVSPKDMKVAVIEDSRDHVSTAAIAGSLSLIPPGSLLMVVRGMILAHSFPVAITRVPVTINQDMKALTPFDSSLLPYLMLLCEGMKSEVLGLVDRSTHGTCKLESTRIFGLPIPVPPIAEQARIVAGVAELRRLCTELRQRLAAKAATQSQLTVALVESSTA